MSPPLRGGTPDATDVRERESSMKKDMEVWNCEYLQQLAKTFYDDVVNLTSELHDPNAQVNHLQGMGLPFLRPMDIDPSPFLNPLVLGSVTTCRQCLVRQVTSRSSVMGQVTRNCTCQVIEI